MAEVHTMKLHETIQVENGWSVLRVPSGWIYFKNTVHTFVPMPPPELNVNANRHRLIDEQIDHHKEVHFLDGLVEEN